MQPLGRLSRIAGCALIVPPPMPMVFSVRNYVRAARISLLDRDWDGAEFLGELCACQAILLQLTPDSLEGVRGLYRRISGLP